MSGPGEADAGKVATSPDGARAGKRGVQAPRSAGGQDAKGAWPGDKKGGVVLDLIVDLPVQELWALFTSDSEKSTMWRRLNRHRKYEEVTTGEWSASKGEGRERESTYITGFKSSFIRGKHKTYETHRVVLEPEGGASFAMEVSASATITRTQLRRFFQTFDEDCSGYLTTAELRHVMTKLGQHLGDRMFMPPRILVEKSTDEEKNW